MVSNETHQSKIKMELTKLLYKQLIYGLIGESLAAFMLSGALLFSNFNIVILTIWLISNLLFCGLFRYILYFKFREEVSKKNLTSNKLNFWLNLFMMGVIFSGVSWGAAGYIFSLNTHLILQSFVLILLIGVVAVANPLYSPVKNMYVPFLFLSFFPLVILLLSQNTMAKLLGLLGLVYIGLMYIFSNYYYKFLYQTLMLKFKNDHLVENLSITKNQLEKHASSLEKSFALQKATLESTTDGILAIGLNNRIENYNQKFVQMWHVPVYLLETKNGKKLFDVMLSQLENEESLNKLLKVLIHTPEERKFHELVFKDERVFECNSHPLYVGNKCEGEVFCFRDITSRKFMEEKLFHQANYDSLTGLPNRALVLDRLSQKIILAKQNKKLIAVFFIDVDRFKLINDTLGHSVGDQLLIEVARRLVKSVRETDTVSREGGDEFLIILSDLDDMDFAMQVATNAAKIMRDPIFIGGNKLNVTISIGVSFYPKDGKDPEVLIRNADIAMYQAKEMGRNNVQFFTEEMNEKTLQRMIMENHLREAIYLNELNLLYQPILSLKTGRIVGLEALLRWNHFKFGNKPISEIITLAEETGLIFAVGDWVLYAACKQLKKWQKIDLPDIHLSINFSPKQFMQANFVEKIAQTIKDTQVNPNGLIFEITENVIMENIENAISILNQIKSMGISVVIDDFGTGYSSLNYLKRLPVDKVKIDRSFIKDLPHNSNDVAITTAILALTACLNIKVIAEGVEKEEQLVFLTAHHCDEIQGDFFSKPLDEPTVTLLLLEGKGLNIQNI